MIRQFILLHIKTRLLLLSRTYNYSKQSNHKPGINKRSIESPLAQNKLGISSLAQLIKKRNSCDERQNFDNMHSDLFHYGYHPFKISLQLMIFFKYGYWQSSEYANDRLRLFLEKVNSQSQIGRTSTQSDPYAVKRYQLVKEYHKRLALQLIPSNVGQSWYASSYVHQLFCFLQTKPSLTPIEIHQIIVNLNSLIHSDQRQQYYVNKQDDAWQLIQATSLFLDHYVEKINEISNTQKSVVYMIAKSLRVTNFKFLQFVKRDLQKDKKDMNLKYFLAGFIYLSQHHSFPYEYFYRQKDRLMNFLEVAENLSDKKVHNCISMLEILGRERLFYCQNIIDRLLKCLNANLGATDTSQLARIFYHYSRLKCTTDYVFVGKLVQRLYLFMHRLDSRHYALIIKAVARLDYQDQQLIRKLKDYDYELFLSSLKYGCQKLGNYYVAILQEIQINFIPNQSAQQDKKLNLDQVISKENQSAVSAVSKIQ